MQVNVEKERKNIDKGEYVHIPKSCIQAHLSIKNKNKKLSKSQ